VGPIFSLRRHLDKVQLGEATGPARCREDDFFQELFDLVNLLLVARTEKVDENKIQ
jgi:hypothetical protein